MIEKLPMLTLEQTAPPLMQFCGSWVIINDHGRAILETWRKDHADRCAEMGYTVLPIDEYLAKLNRSP